MRVFVLVIIVCVSITARAESWTNAAGHSVEARLVSGNERALVFESSDGSTFRMPVNSLSEASQERARAHLALAEEPSVGDRAQEDSAALARRAELLRDNAAITDEELDRILAALDASSGVKR